MLNIILNINDIHNTNYYKLVNLEVSKYENDNKNNSLYK